MPVIPLEITAYEKTGRREGIGKLPGFFGRRSGGIPARLSAKDALRDVKKKFLSIYAEAGKTYWYVSA